MGSNTHNVAATPNPTVNSAPKAVASSNATPKVKHTGPMLVLGVALDATHPLLMQSATKDTLGRRAAIPMTGFTLTCSKPSTVHLVGTLTQKIEGQTQSSKVNQEVKCKDASHVQLIGDGGLYTAGSANLKVTISADDMGINVGTKAEKKVQLFIK